MTLRELFEEAGLSPHAYRTSHDYWRGEVYGCCPCLAVTVSGSVGHLFAAVLRAVPVQEGATERLLEEWSDLFEDMRSDAEGPDVVYYFPGVEFEQGGEPEEDGS